jgi:hypothetical protein
MLLQGNYNLPKVGSIVQFQMTFNPAAIPGVSFYNSSSGWYRVTQVIKPGLLAMLFEEPVKNPVAVIPFNDLFVVSGEPGLTGIRGTQGTVGLVGNIGQIGDPGASGGTGSAGHPLVPPFSGTSPAKQSDQPPNWVGNTGIGYIGPLTSWNPAYNSSGHLISDGALGYGMGSRRPSIILPHAGTYVIWANYWPGIVQFSAGPGITANLTSAVIECKLVNVTTLADVAGSRTQNYVEYNNPAWVVPAMSMGVVTTTTTNNEIAVAGHFIYSNLGTYFPSFILSYNNLPFVEWVANSLKAVQIA